VETTSLKKSDMAGLINSNKAIHFQCFFKLVTSVSDDLKAYDDQVIDCEGFSARFVCSAAARAFAAVAADNVQCLQHHKNYSNDNENHTNLIG
jgi:hypothetical protein